MRNESLCFFKTEEQKIITTTVVHKGIAKYCCKKMKKACTPFNTKEKERYGKHSYIFADSRIYDKNNNKIGITTHSAYGACDYRKYYNFVEFSFCPFCGTRINGYVEVD